MEVPIYIAKIAAALYLCVGLGALFNKKYFQKVVQDLLGNAGIGYISGILALIIGFLMVSVYNVWAWNWTVLVTIMGWAALVKGALYLLLPEQFNKLSASLVKGTNLQMMGAGSVILGLIFGYFGFVA